MSKCRVILNVLNPSIIHGLYFLKTDRSRLRSAASIWYCDFRRKYWKDFISPDSRRTQ